MRRRPAIARPVTMPPMVITVSERTPRMLYRDSAAAEPMSVHQGERSDGGIREPDLGGHGVRQPARACRVLPPVTRLGRRDQPPRLRGYRQREYEHPLR